MHYFMFTNIVMQNLHRLSTFLTITTRHATLTEVSKVSELRGTTVRVWSQGRAADNPVLFISTVNPVLY